jgi:hypothetical protein
MPSDGLSAVPQRLLRWRSCKRQSQHCMLYSYQRASVACCVLQRSTLYIRVRCNMHSLSHWIVVNERRLSAVSGRIRSGQWPCTRTTTSTRTHSSSPRVGIAPTRLLTQSRSCTEETPLLVSLLRCCWKGCQSKHGCTLHVSSLRCKRS